MWWKLQPWFQSALSVAVWGDTVLVGGRAAAPDQTATFEKSPRVGKSSQPDLFGVWEPARALRARATQTLLGYGTNARPIEQSGKGVVQVESLLQNGSIQDQDHCLHWLEFLTRQYSPPSVFAKPDLFLGLPTAISPFQRRLWQKLAWKVGFGEVVTAPLEYALVTGSTYEGQSEFERMLGAAALDNSAVYVLVLVSGSTVQWCTVAYGRVHALWEPTVGMNWEDAWASYRSRLAVEVGEQVDAYGGLLAVWPSWSSAKNPDFSLDQEAVVQLSHRLRWPIIPVDPQVALLGLQALCSTGDQSTLQW